MKTKNYLFIILNLAVAISFFYINKIPIPKEYFNIASLLWNAILGLLLALIFINREFLAQIKTFSIKWLILGLSLTSFVAYLANYLYSTYVTSPAISNLFSKDIETLFLALPVLVLGQEIISTNVTTGLKKLGLNFWFASIIVAILFAFWHIKYYGFIPLQLLAIIAPIRLALNYVWKESSSLLVVVLVHYIFNVLAFVIYY
ncbi:CPBP family glutamic-type intramembrane protease [Gemelliphila palaticanis]|uniref:CPBP family intramembrane metalloprotease n=1 Tax=Gemelliphila palaticanis TaxID=81950 RepID=A0ABX2T510_9BACL|nr:CPBP family glutamic-type intramembrane protease [Gemella palaticanis]MBF0716156.1 CPBP family intramembrane metalloprotease [Gemella palaticanis]NYS48086.1 CPBP family intramembrane metalloprotease [Gemella palaticanis]